jgi:hypothetical protein
LKKENEEEKRERKDVSLRSSNVRQEQTPKKRSRAQKGEDVGRLLRAVPKNLYK